MKSNSDQSKVPQSKPSVKDQPQNRLNEDGPNQTQEGKIGPFRRLLNSLWGPVRG